MKTNRLTAYRVLPANVRQRLYQLAGYSSERTAHSGATKESIRGYVVEQHGDWFYLCSRKVSKPVEVKAAKI